MSNYLAIATATAALKDLLHTHGMQDVNGADVITMRPDDAAKQAGSKINIYLYQVTPNAAWRNADVPTRRADGTVLQRPLAALDLHYMISFYGDEGDFVSQRLLGSVVRTLHAEPQLTRERLQRAALTVTAGDGSHILATSNLADQIELVKFSPLHLSLEELSKIWSVFYQIPYALSVAYQASVVLIEGEETPTNALSVQVRNVYAVPFHQPVIEQIVVKPEANQSIIANRPITVDKTLLIRGKRLLGDKGTIVQIGGFEITPKDVSDTEITLPLANTTVRLPDGIDVPLANLLRAGVQGLQVIHRRQMGIDKANDQANWHRGVESNIVAFVLRPTITDASGKVAGEVTVTLKPAVRKGQRVVLLLNELTPQPRQPGTPLPKAYTFDADPNKQIWQKNQADEEVSDTIKFVIPAIKPKTTYLVRIQVDGAESLLDVDTDPKSPTFNMYIGTPKVDIP